MAEEEGQIFPGGEIIVATTELNPVFTDIFIMSLSTGKSYHLVDDNIEILDVVIDRNLPEPIWYLNITNSGDEPIGMKFNIYIDGKLEANKEYSNVAPNDEMSPSGILTMPPAGKHRLFTELYAKRVGGSYPATPQVSNDFDFYVYTLPLDAIATTVKIIQNTTEQLWLTGTPESFTTQPVIIAPNEPTYFKFELTNPGDEPVRMNVGHLVDTVYETGFLVGGVLMDTIEKDMLVNAGATAVINTEEFTPLAAGSLTIGSFAVLRARHLI